MLTAVGVFACSSADDPEGDDAGTGGSSGSGGSATGGSATGGSATGGTSTGGSATGGTSSGGTSSGGSTATGGTGGDAPNPDPECKGIKSNMACPIEGKACPNMACGLADSGRRECNCATTWNCAACDFTNSPFRDRPASIPTCPTEAGDEVACTSLNAVCGPLGDEYCACYQDAQDGLIWDCDSPPSSWGM